LLIKSPRFNENFDAESVRSLAVSKTSRNSRLSMTSSRLNKILNVPQPLSGTASSMSRVSFPARLSLASGSVLTRGSRQIVQQCKAASTTKSVRSSIRSVATSRRVAVVDEEREKKEKHILEIINSLNDEELKKVTELLKDDIDLDEKIDPEAEEKEDDGGLGSEVKTRPEDADDLVRQDDDAIDLASIQVPETTP